jgi:hypothetical protein
MQLWGVGSLSGLVAGLAAERHGHVVCRTIRRPRYALSTEKRPNVEMYLNVVDPSTFKPCLMVYTIDVLNTTASDSLPPIPKRIRFRRRKQRTFDATVDSQAGAISHESAIAGTDLRA